MLVPGSTRLSGEVSAIQPYSAEEITIVSKGKNIHSPSRENLNVPEFRTFQQSPPKEGIVFHKRSSLEVVLSKIRYLYKSTDSLKVKPVQSILSIIVVIAAPQLQHLNLLKNLILF